MSMITRLSLARRRALMFVKRRCFRWRGVDRRSYIVGGSVICRDLRLGAYSFINTDCRICPRVKIGRYVMLGPRVSIIGGDHNIDQVGVPIVFSGRPSLRETIIQDDCWIGLGVVIKAGVTIHRGAIVAAGCIVTKDVPPYEIHVGAPNSRLRNRFANSEDRDIHDRMVSSKELFVGKPCSRKTPLTLESS